MSFRSVNRRDFMRGAVASGFVGAVGACATGGRPRGKADLVLFNGRITTQNPGAPEVSAVAVRGEQILATGSDAQMRSLGSAGTRVIDLGGRRVIPGLNDSHMHPTRGGRFFAAELRWDGVRTLQRALDMIAEQARRTPQGQWVRVIGGWSPYQFEERRMPTPEELTRAAPNTPVFVLFLYSGGFLNQAGIEALGITADTPAPPGTAYEIGADGRPTGRLLAQPNPTILYQTIGKLPPLSADEQAISTRYFYRELNRFGLTSVIDAGGGGHTFPEDYVGTKALADRGLMPIRISNYLFPQKPGRELEQFQSWIERFEVGVNRAKSLTDGYVVRGGGEFLVWAAGDYENFMADRPDITTRDRWREQLMDVTRELLANQWPLRIHATYDESVNAIMGVFEEAHRKELDAGREGFGGVRWAFDHGETLMPETIARIRGLGGGLATQSRMAYAGEYFVERYGRKLAERAPPYRDLLDAGIPLGLGSDATRVSRYNPWVTLYWATTGRSIGGTPLLGQRHQLSRAEALYLHTVGSAWFSQEEDRKGRIAVGQLADLAVLSDDYFAVGDEQLPRIESVLTVTGGRPVYGSDGFEDLVEPLPPLEPDWSPVNRFGAYPPRATSGVGSSGRPG